jgi:hypothetical protein
MTFDQIIGMIPMRNGLMAAIWTMCMLRGVTLTNVRWRTLHRVSGTHFEPVLVDMIPVLAMQMPVMQVI